MAGFGLNLLQNTFFTETFPTSYRSTAQGANAAMNVVGGMIGLALESVLYQTTGSHWSAVSLLMLPAFASPVIVHLFLPETSGRELDEISPEVALSGNMQGLSATHVRRYGVNQKGGEDNVELMKDLSMSYNTSG
jgi:hypothetical protein